MAKRLVFPEGYKSSLTQKETQRAIKVIKDTFQVKLAQALNLDRVTAPLIVTKASGINDDLNGVERKVHFTAQRRLFSLLQSGKDVLFTDTATQWARAFIQI